MSDYRLDPQDQAWRDPGVIPVVTLEDSAVAVPLARSLVTAGLRHIEVTLRTAAALDSISRIARDVPEAVVGAGTVKHPEDITAAVEAGAQFLVSPGVTSDLILAGLQSPVPFLPGCATPSEAMRLAEAGYSVLKFFAAEAYGGAETLRSLSAPLADIAFVPTGGIDGHNLAAYLALPNVVAVGGSWMVRSNWIAAGDFERIGSEALAAYVEARRARTEARAGG